MNQRKAGVILSYLSQIIQILSGLIYTPIMLRLLGQSQYGLYQLVFSVVSYLSLLSFGFTASYMRFYARAKAQGDKDEVSKLNGMYMIIFLVIAGVCIFCGSVMIRNIEIVFSDGLTLAEYPIAQKLMALMILNLALTFPNSVFDAFTSAHEKFYFQKLLLFLQNLLNPFLTLPLLLLGYGSIGMVCITTILTIAKLMVNMWFCIKKLQVRFVFRGFKLNMIKEMFVFTFFIFLNQIIDQINWSVDKFLLGRIVGTSAVAIYGLGGQINAMYLQFSTSVSNVFVPRVNKIVATSNDNNELTRLFTQIGRIQFLILSLILTGFIFFGESFMFFWGGDGYGDSYYVALWLIIPVTVALIQNLGIEIQRAKNMHKTRSIVYFVIAIANIFMSIPLIKCFGPIGAAMGTAISLTVGNILIMNWYYHNRIGLDMRYFWKNIVKFVPGLVGPCVIGTLIKLLVPMKSFAVMCAWIIVYIVVFCISMFYLGMNAEEKGILKGIIKKIQR